MSPIKPPVAAPGTGVPKPPHAVQGKAAEKPPFRPGIVARAAVVESPPQSPPVQPSQQRASPHAQESHQLFTVQSLSAYAGVLVADETNGADANSGNPARSASTEGPPRRPGSVLDMKA